MEIIFRICLFIAGIINFVPSILSIIPDKIESSYGVRLDDSNLELLLRHRAVLFGIVGGIMIYSSFTKRYYSLALLIGFISMISFLILFMIVDGEINSELNKVLKADIVGLIFLITGAGIYKFMID